MGNKITFSPKSLLAGLIGTAVTGFASAKGIPAPYAATLGTTASSLVKGIGLNKDKETVKTKIDAALDKEWHNIEVDYRLSAPCISHLKQEIMGESTTGEFTRNLQGQNTDTVIAEVVVSILKKHRQELNEDPEFIWDDDFIKRVGFDISARLINALQEVFRYDDIWKILKAIADNRAADIREHKEIIESNRRIEQQLVDLVKIINSTRIEEFDPNTQNELTDGFIVTHEYGIFGRKREVRIVLDYLQENKAVIVCGEGGIGKTELCREVISQCERKEFVVTLQEIKSYNDLLLKFIDVLRLSPEQDIVSQENAIFDKISVLNKDSWIIYLDNLEELLSEKVDKSTRDKTERFIRRIKECSNNYLLISSRYKMSRKAGFRTVTLDTLNKNDATDLFCSIWFSDEEYTALQKKEIYDFVVSELYCYPLSVILTASQAENKITLESLKQKWRRSKKNIRQLYPDNTRHESLVTALQISYEDIKDSPECCEIWAAFSYLPGKIPEELLIDFFNGQGESLELISNCLDKMVRLSIVRREVCKILRLDGNEAESEVIDMLQPLRQVIDEISGIREKKANALQLIKSWFQNKYGKKTQSTFDGCADTKYLIEHIDDFLYFMEKLIEEDDFKLLNDLHLVAYNYYFDKPYASINMILMALTMAEMEKAENAEIAGSFQWVLGRLYVYIGKVQEAMNCYSIAKAFFEISNSDLGLANVFLSYGILFADLEKYDEANNSFDNALRLYEHVNSDHGRYLTFIKKAEISLDLNMFVEAEEYCTEAEKISAKNANIYDISRIFLLHAFIEFDKDNIAVSENWLIKAEEYNRDLLDKNGLATALSLRGNCMQRKELIAESIPYYEEALILFKETDDIINIGLTLSRLSFVYASIYDQDKTRTYLKEAKEIQEKIPFVKYKKAMNYNLVEAEMLIGMINIVHD